MAGLAAGLAAAAALLAGPASAAPTTSPATATFTVSPNGTGTSCSAAAPCSIQTAQHEVRQADGTVNADIAVILQGGTYTLTQTLAFNSADGDSAPAGHTVTYEAAPGATPILSGGESVSGWTQTTGGIWEAKVPAGTATRQLYVDGVRANIASGSVPGNLTQTATGYTASSDALDSWSDVTAAEFAYNASWTESYCGIASVSGETITMQEPCFQNSTLKQYGVNVSTPTAMQNTLELLTQPGQWDLNPATNTIYYMPREGQNMATASAVIPNLQTLVSGTGTEADPLTGLAFQGISFEYGGWTAPNGPNGYSEVQADLTLDGADAYADQGSCTWLSKTDPGTCPYGAWDLTPGNVVFDHTSGLSITGSTFEHLGAAGLQLGQDADNSTIQGNVFTDISANGLEIGNGSDADPTDLKLLPTGNTISDNWVHNVAVQYSGGVGIFQGYTRNDVIEHNQVNDVPYSGISSNWGWGVGPTESSGNKIVDNLVYNFLQQHIDGGGIYVLGIEGSSLATGLLISGNVVREADGSIGHAIYTDGGSEYITMTDNAIYDNGGIPSMGGSYEGGGTPFGDFDFTGNYVEDTTPDWPAGNPTNAYIYGNTQVGSTGAGVPASLLANAGLQRPYTGLTAAQTGTAPVNLALHKPAQAQYLDGSTAELQPGDKVSYATDGNSGTAVQAYGQYLWQLVVDLQQSQTLGSATVTMPKSAYATAFHVDASTDGTTWTTVGSVTNSGPGTYPVVFSSPVTARYLRIVADAPDSWSQTGGQMAISEVGAYAPTTGQANLALNQPALALFLDGTSAQMQPGDQPSYAVDGNTSTAAQASGQYRWIEQVDLQKIESINEITVDQPSSAYATEFHVDVSQDGSTFYTVAWSKDSAAGTTGIQLATPVEARYIRIIADRPDNGGQTGGQMAISELGVYDL
jgi:hypothetical protein